MMSFLARLIASVVIFRGDAYRVGNQDVQLALVRANASAASAHDKIAEATDSRMLVAMWNEIRDAMRHTATGAVQAMEFAASIDGRYAEIDSTISANSLGTILGGGEFTIADTKNMEDGQMILTVNTFLTDFFRDVVLLVHISSSLLSTMSKAAELTQSVPDFSPAADAMGTQDCESLQFVASSLNNSYFVEPVCEQLGETLDPLLLGWGQPSSRLTAWGQARRVARGGEPLQSSLRSLSEVWVSLGTVHQTGDLQVLLNNTFRVANSMLEATRTVRNLVDRVFGATEIIDREFCEHQPTHNFFITRQVDDDTMSCVEYSIIARKTCRCRNENDCYVSSDKRPTPPAGTASKRCFRPMDRSPEVIDRSLCVLEVEHSFSSSATVDETMECSASGLFWSSQTCRCRFPDDCYAQEEHRPSPSELHRCFRPFNATADTPK